MKYIIGFLCLAVAIICYTKTELLTDNVNTIFGSIFILLANLFFNKKDQK